MAGEDSIPDLVEGRPMFDLWARINAEGLNVVASQMKGPVPPKGFMTDGCTHCPDILLGKPAWLPCGWHDWGYDENNTEVPSTSEGRREMDSNLYDNQMQLFVDEPEVTQKAAEVLVEDIWANVRVFGFTHFKT